MAGRVVQQTITMIVQSLVMVGIALLAGASFENGVLGVAGLIGIAALNLVLDFDFIEAGAEQGAPKYMEWYGAFGLMVTLVWLYIEFLRLLAKLQSRD